jgi:atypical dual specificity phosphatase
MSRLRYARLTEGLLGGAMPYTDAHVAALAGEGVTAVVNLCEDREYWQGEHALVAESYRRAGIVEHRLAVPDGSTVPAAVLDRAITVAQGHTLYVHCRGGRERSATVCTAILSRIGGVDVGEALRRAQAANPVFRPLPGQLLGLEAWWQTIARNPA